MVKNIKKRSVSETEVSEKNVDATKNSNKAFKKKKIENKVAQNGQNKQVKKDVPKNLKPGVKKDAGPKQNSNKKNSAVASKNSGKYVLTQKKTTGSKYADLTADELKAKIEEITTRGELTRTAKRKLGFLRKLLRVRQGNTEQGAQQQSQKAKNQKSVEVAKNKQVQNKEQNKKLQGQLDAKSKKQNKKADNKQANQFVKKQQKEDDEEDEDEEDDMDSELSEDEDESDVEEEEGESDEEVEDEEESEDDDDENENVEDENKNDKVKTNNVQPAEKKESNKTEEQKKKRYVLFVGNLPYSITTEELKKHFLTKVSHIVNIRIPTKDGNTSRGFAYVELANNTDFEKAFSLNHSVINGRRINVQYSGANKKEGVAKNFKLNALHKAGKFAGGKNRNQQKNFNNKKK